MSREHSKDLDMVSGCSHESKMHLYSAGQQCQWCHCDMDEIELNKRREAMRWRKWPEEKPIESGMCLVFKKWAAGRERIVDVQFFHVNEGIYDVGPEWFTHWMPMIPLPRCE